MTAPLASRAVPVIWPVAVCAKAGEVIVLSTVTNATIKTLGGEERLLTISLLMEAVIDIPDQIATVSIRRSDRVH